MLEFIFKLVKNFIVILLSFFKPQNREMLIMFFVHLQLIESQQVRNWVGQGACIEISHRNSIKSSWRYEVHCLFERHLSIKQVKFQLLLVDYLRLDSVTMWACNKNGRENSWERKRSNVNIVHLIFDDLLPFHEISFASNANSRREHECMYGHKKVLASFVTTSTTSTSTTGHWQHIRMNGLSPLVRQMYCSEN